MRHFKRLIQPLLSHYQLPSVRKQGTYTYLYYSFHCGMFISPPLTWDSERIWSQQFSYENTSYSIVVRTHKVEEILLDRMPCNSHNYCFGVNVMYVDRMKNALYN